MADVERFRWILAACQFQDWRFRVESDESRAYLQVEAKDSCAESGGPITWRGRKWLLSDHMTQSEVVQTAFKAVMTAVEHEAREKFLYRGHAIFGPHFDVDRLVELCITNNSTSVRALKLDTEEPLG